MCGKCGFRISETNEICKDCTKDIKTYHYDEEAHKRVIESMGKDHTRIKTVPTDIYLDLYTYWEMAKNKM